MQRDAAGIPLGLAKEIPNRSNWLAYLLERAKTQLEHNGMSEISDALYRADIEWLKAHVRRDK